MTWASLRHFATAWVLPANGTNASYVCENLSARLPSLSSCVGGIVVELRARPEHAVPKKRGSNRLAVLLRPDGVVPVKEDAHVSSAFPWNKASLARHSCVSTSTKSGSSSSS
ncbi:hypothetical protein B0T24DRAFT_589674 [Lasiosphaeria ovina]|uniref:Secreted protein n=1 Tax=Lasiosphaeria ovina TaxID=92902 RepID=A0AAE0KLR6_9PEZI|nr:hypothetical protein B0T24DRAFT_589674 [Lasiosphaeria ovina]